MLHVRQRSATHGFAYDVRDDAGAVVGHLDWPWLAQARNARLKWHGDDPRPDEMERDRQLFFAVMALHDLT